MFSYFLVTPNLLLPKTKFEKNAGKVHETGSVI